MKIESWHIEALKYLSRRGKPVPEDDLTPLTLEYLDVCAAHGLAERFRVQKAHFWRLTDKGKHVAAIGRFDQ